MSDPDPDSGSGEAKAFAFLRARWHNLILANYRLPEGLVRLPPGLELDRHDGSAWCSLVAFQFLKTRVLGIGWPGYRNFPEWNLRFYVRLGERRGVSFVREFVPQWLVATMARVLYNEPYRSAPMTMSIQESEDSLEASYSVKWAGRVHSLRSRGNKPAIHPGPGSAEHFFKEHSWGFGVDRSGGLIRYEVNHPEWDVYPVQEFEANVDWGLLYGPEWAVMNGKKPDSVVLARGSEVSVYPRG